MKRLMTAALALSLLGGTSVFAQQPPESGARPERPNAHPPGGQPGGRPPQGGQPGGRPAGPPPQQARPTPPPNYQRPPEGGAGRPEGGPGERPNRPPNANPSYPGNRPAPGNPNYNRPPGPGNPGGRPPEGGRPQEGNRPPEGNRPSEGNRPPQGGGRPSQPPRNVPSNYRPGWGAPGYRPGGPQPRYDPRYFPRNYRPARTYAWRGSAWRPQPGFYYRRWAYGDRLPFGWFGPQWYIDDYYYYDLPVPPYGYEWVRVGPDALLVDLDSGAVVSAVYGLFY